MTEESRNPDYETAFWRLFEKIVSECFLRTHLGLPQELLKEALKVASELDPDLMVRKVKEITDQKVSQIAKEKGLSESDVWEKMKGLCEKFVFNEVEALEIIDVFMPSRIIRIEEGRGEMEERIRIRRHILSINRKIGEDILFWVTCPYCEEGYAGFLTVSQTVECNECGNRFLVEAGRSGFGKVVH